MAPTLNLTHPKYVVTPKVSAKENLHLQPTTSHVFILLSALVQIADPEVVQQTQDNAMNNTCECSVLDLAH
ncbi:hypothetical protein J6590_009543 [Homalodisca vitripennis]|nr:hypothetical protein J6590_009543 [Homalodisca vitripennis]